MREEGEIEEGQMMLKIDEITHFFVFKKFQNTNRVCFFEAQHLRNLEIFANDKKSNFYGMTYIADYHPYLIKYSLGKD